MLAAPFTELLVAPMCFYNKQIDVAMIVHGDDFFAEGPQKHCFRLATICKTSFGSTL